MTEQNSSKAPSAEAPKQPLPPTPVIQAAPAQTEVSGQTNTATNDEEHPTQGSPWNSREIARFVGEGILVIIGIGALCIYGRQLNQMIESNKTNREALVSVQRAFVFPKDVKLYQPDGSGYFPMAQVIASIENSGSTPAKNLIIRINDRIIIPGVEKIPDDFDFPDSVKGDPAPRMLGPKQITIGPIALMSPSCLDFISHGFGQLFVWGRISYSDVFGQDHETDFCWQYVTRVSEYPGGTNPLNVFFPCPWHNCVDEDCWKKWPKKRRAELFPNQCPIVIVKPTPQPGKKRK